MGFNKWKRFKELALLYPLLFSFSFNLYCFLKKINKETTKIYGKKIKKEDGNLMPKVKSPFSLEHKWSVNWTRIPSSIRVDPRVMTHTEREAKALRFLASVGLISIMHLVDWLGLSFGLVIGWEKRS